MLDQIIPLRHLMDMMTDLFSQILLHGSMISMQRLQIKMPPLMENVLEISLKLQLGEKRVHLKHTLEHGQFGIHFILILIMVVVESIFIQSERVFNSFLIFNSALANHSLF